MDLLTDQWERTEESLLKKLQYHGMLPELLIDIEDEDWVPIRGYSSYLVSNKGRVINLRDSLLKPNTSEWGYLYVVLSVNGQRKTEYVHRLVADAFVPGFDNGLEVNHIDGNKTNNNDENLEWVTKSMNNQHAIDSGLRKPSGTRIRIVETGEEFPTVKACAEFLGTWPTVISEVLNGRRPHYKHKTFARVRSSLPSSA